LNPASPRRNFRILILLPPLFFFFGARATLNAQDKPPPPPGSQNRIAPPMRDNAVMFRIVTRVMEKDETEAWNSETYKVTIPGRPVGLKIVGENIAVSVKFTLYQHRNRENIIVAQGQIFIETPDGGVQGKTMMHILPFDFGEQIFFFPLGPGNSDDEAHIEIQLEMTRYNGTAVNGGAGETFPETQETALN
jgi:hypothetical protein